MNLTRFMYWIYANENIWLPQKRMAELFGCSADNISLHLKNIYKERELDESATAEDFSVVQIEGNREVTRTIRCYSLEAKTDQENTSIRRQIGALVYELYGLTEEEVKNQKKFPPFERLALP